MRMISNVLASALLATGPPDRQRRRCTEQRRTRHRTSGEPHPVAADRSRDPYAAGSDPHGRIRHTDAGYSAELSLGRNTRLGRINPNTFRLRWRVSSAWAASVVTTAARYRACPRSSCFPSSVALRMHQSLTTPQSISSATASSAASIALSTFAASPPDMTAAPSISPASPTSPPVACLSAPLAAKCSELRGQDTGREP